MVDNTLRRELKIFTEVVGRMHAEGDGMLTLNLLTAQDAAKMVLLYAMGMGNVPRFYVTECDNFLVGLGDTPAKCTASHCDNQMHKNNDVGTIIIVHGMCDHPDTCITSAICQACWKERFGEDKEKALDGFVSYFGSLVPGIHFHGEIDAMSGNAPTSTAIN